MGNQRKYKPYELNRFFADQMAMRTPPPGTIPRGQIIGRPALTSGQLGGSDVVSIPMPVDLALLRKGRLYFENVCAACHGVLGDGNSVVADNMRLRAPPSIVTAKVSAFPAGRIYRVISAGYGVMPRFGYRFAVTDRWAIVAYLQALQLSSRPVPLSSLTQEQQRRALDAL